MSIEPDTQFEKEEFEEFSVTSSLDIPLSPIDSKSLKPIPRIHPQYYLQDELSVFLVNNAVIFRVHRHLFDRESAIFRSFPTGTDENPVLLEDACPDEFVALLEYFYDGVHGDTPRSSEDWMHLLSISDQFKMPKVQKRAIRELDNMPLDPVDKIVLAVDHDVPEWLIPAYVELCKREEPLREEEAEKVGLITTVKLFRAREEIRQVEKRQVVMRCQNCNRTAPHNPPGHCLSCNHLAVVPCEDPSAATPDNVHIGKVVADIFYPPIMSPMLPDHPVTPGCPPVVPEGSREKKGKKGKKVKGG